jgi:MFS family permease
VARDTWSSLRFPEYRDFLVAMGAVFLATQVQSTVLGWQVYALTRDPLSLGFVGLAEALPFLALTLLGGWEADRRDRRALSLWSLAAVALSGLVLLVATFAPLRSALPLYGAQVLAGIGRAYFRPASLALGTELVPREHYQNAASWRSTVFHTAMVLGPALGGGLIALGAWLADPAGGGAPGGEGLGYRLAYGLVLALSLAGFVSLSLIRPRPRPASRRDGVWAGLAEGVRFVFAQPVLLGAMSLDLFAVLFGGALALLPVFASEVLGVGGIGFGLLRAAPAVGSVVMSFVMARVGELRRSGATLLWAVAVFGLSWIAFALSRSYVLSLALLVLGGMLDNVSVVLRSTLVQVWTPADKMGRVAAVNSFFIGSSNELGAFESGAMARLLGLVPSVIFGGAMTLVTVGVVAWAAPALRRLRGIRPEHEPSGAGAPGP